MRFLFFLFCLDMRTTPRKEGSFERRDKGTSSINWEDGRTEGENKIENLLRGETSQCSTGLSDDSIFDKNPF